jgi:hypothetical protein
MASCWPPGSWDEEGDMQNYPNHVYTVHLNDSVLCVCKDTKNAFDKLWTHASEHITDFLRVPNPKNMKEAREKEAQQAISDHGSWHFSKDIWYYRIIRWEVEE